MVDERRAMPITAAADALLQSARRAGSDLESLDKFNESLADFLEAWGEARTSLVGDRAVSAVTLASRIVAGDVSAPVSANGMVPLPGDKIQFADGSRARVSSTVLTRPGKACMITLEDGRTLGRESVANVRVLNPFRD